MSSYPLRPAPHKEPLLQSAPTNPIHIKAWADETAEALQQEKRPEAPVRGTSVSLAIPLDKEHESGDKDQEARVEDDNVTARASYVPRREPLRRDSLKRREALLKGREGTRRRQRWENDHLLSNPWAQPPLPSDWEVHPTHPRMVVPYFLAPLWDAQVAARREAEQKRRIAKAKGSNPRPTTPTGTRSRKGSKSKHSRHGSVSSVDTKGELDMQVGHVPKELRSRLKRAKAARGLLIALEEEVRRFVMEYTARHHRLRERGLSDAVRAQNDSDDEEIVFVGRGGEMVDMPASPSARRASMAGSEEELVEVQAGDDVVERERMVYDSLADDQAASFGRWLVHSIANYYGLQTWSVTVGNPARREAYVAVRRLKSGRVAAPDALPRPLWGLV